MTLPLRNIHRNYQPRQLPAAAAQVAVAHAAAAQAAVVQQAAAAQAAVVQQAAAPQAVLHAYQANGQVNAVAQPAAQPQLMDADWKDHNDNGLTLT